MSPTFYVLAFLCISIFTETDAETVKVMTLNTWNCGTNVENGEQKLAARIAEKDADIVFLQETHRCDAGTWTQPELSGYTRCLAKPAVAIPPSYPAQILFKKDKFEEVSMDLPNPVLFIPARKFASRELFCQVALKQSPDERITLVSLNWYNAEYGPDRACGFILQTPATWTKEDYMSYRELEQRGNKLGDMMDQFEAVYSLSDEIVIFGADLNAPATLDYEGDAGEGHCGMRDFKWTTSDTMTGHGFVDAYREKFPNVVEYPGYTSSPVYGPSSIKKKYPYTLAAGTAAPPQERRDFVYYRTDRKKSKTISVSAAEVYHGQTPVSSAEQMAYYNDGDTLLGTDANKEAVRQNEWPSDHSAVVVDLDIV